jgi:hypothetical protein
VVPELKRARRGQPTQHQHLLVDEIEPLLVPGTVLIFNMQNMAWGKNIKNKGGAPPIKTYKTGRHGHFVCCFAQDRDYFYILDSNPHKPRNPRETKGKDDLDKYTYPSPSCLHALPKALVRKYELEYRKREGDMEALTAYATKGCPHRDPDGYRHGFMLLAEVGVLSVKK